MQNSKSTLIPISLSGSNIRLVKTRHTMLAFFNTIRARIRQCCNNKYLVCIIIFFVFAFNYVYMYRFGESTKDSIVDPDSTEQIELRVYGNPKGDSTFECILPRLNPWDPSILKIVEKPISTKPKSCNPTFTVCTSLEKGILSIIDFNDANKTASDCSFRCLHAVNDYEMKVGEWTVIDAKNGSTPGCDIVEVKCGHPTNYSFIHTQIVENQKPNVTAKDPKNQPDVYWIILDSVSMSMFRRAMINTTKFLKEKLGAIEFPYLNKVNLNSRPNSYAMFFGKHYDHAMDVWCKQALDDKGFIGFEFQKAGYLTHQTEDWALGAVNWPSCEGFRTKQVDHFMRPFWLRLDGPRKYYDKPLRKKMLEESCTQDHQYLFEHLLQFAHAYDEQPKFSYTWIVQLAHNYNSALFREDDRFLAFFEKLYEKAKNAFIIFQSDHGIRFGKIRDIPTIGSTEDNNPFLMIALPEKLRKNKSLVKQMEENSQQLLSQHDLYATTLQIAKFSHEWNETTDFNKPMPEVTDHKLFGSSLFHKMKQPRVCESLGIPFEYCICSQQAREVKDKTLTLKVVQALIDSMNTKLEKSEYKNRCHKHTPSDKYPILLEELRKLEPETRIFRAKFETLPGDALYQGIVRMYKNETMTLINPTFYRINSYAKQANCIPQQFLRNYCICKN